MYKVIEERKEIEECVNTVIYEYDHESLDSAMKHIDLRSTQDCKCYIGSDDKKSKYRRSLMELDKEELIEKLMHKDSKICGVVIDSKQSMNCNLILEKCDLYLEGENKVFEKTSNIKVEIRS